MGASEKILKSQTPSSLIVCDTEKELTIEKMQLCILRNNSKGGDWMRNKIDVTKRIQQLADERGWTEYRLVKSSGLAASTIANIYHRGTTPTIPTLETLCSTFGISLSQFFEDELYQDLSKEQTELLQHFAALTPDQRSIILTLLKSMH